MSLRGGAPVGAGLSQLVEQLRPELLRFLAARLGDAGEAEDVVQDLWLRIRSQAGGPVGNGRAYLYRAAQNLALDRIKERRRRAVRDTAWAQTQCATPDAPEPADVRPDGEAVLLAREQAATLAAAIAALPGVAGRAFRRHKLEGVSHADIARELGITRSGVEKHMAAALAHLRRSFAD